MLPDEKKVYLMKYERLSVRKWHYFFRASALFYKQQISTENVKGFIFMKVMKVIYIYKYLFQSFFFSRQTFFIFLSYSEKIIIYRSYFHILCFPGQRKLKNLRSPSVKYFSTKPLSLAEASANKLFVSCEHFVPIMFC